MNKIGPIVIIEDDLDDRLIFEAIFASLGRQNEIKVFDDGFKALAYLRAPEVLPFLIMSDVQMPKMSGFELRHKVFTEEGLNYKCFPYIFFTNTPNPAVIREAFGLSIQGFFSKPDTIRKFESTLKNIVQYWDDCMSP